MLMKEIAKIISNVEEISSFLRVNSERENFDVSNLQNGFLMCFNSILKVSLL